MQIFGKPSASWLKAKKWFFDEDKMLRDESLSIASIYAAQPKRKACKNCGANLGEKVFTKHGIDYCVCVNCTHLNGMHEDTDSFCQALYGEEKTDIFSQMYSADDLEAFKDRRDLIYRPKADFLLDALRESGEKVEDLTYDDFGAGTGYFVSALKEAGCEKVTGYEVSQNQVETANRMLGPDSLITHDLHEMTTLIRNSQADVLSLVFVLEHVQNPREILQAISDNKKLRYAFIAIPLFSPSSFIELAFQQFAPRHLTNGHTHLYTKKSFEHILNEFGFSPTAEWWFGADIIDFYRMIWMQISSDPDSKGAEAMWEEMLLPVIDDMQLALDKAKIPSEVHMVVKLR